MRRFPLRLGLALAGVSFLSLIVAVGIALAADPEPKPVAGIKNVMQAVNHEEHGLYGMIKKFCDKSDATAEEWKLMRDRAQIVAECANILMPLSAPRGADDAAGIAKWKQHCADFREAGKKLARAMAFKKVDKAKAALADVAASCEACHKDHRSK